MKYYDLVTIQIVLYEKKISNYLLKIILNFCILNFKKMLLYTARVLAFMKFYNLKEKKWD